ncbi:MAG: homoserine O-acetyltransferase [Vampirovibrionales bacterium]|nr:homoserine O-acetyltransferase [Vampirovibrionales bacterium]
MTTLQHLHSSELAAWLETHQAEAFDAWQKECLVTPLQVQFETPLTLESGDILPSFEIRMELYGQLNAEKDNVILVCHALTGDAHLAGRHQHNDKKAGWWDDLVGEGKAFNPQTHAILCTHVLGGCNGSTGPESVHPETQAPYHTSFPPITIADMVNAQHAVMQALCIPQWQAVVGGSMGGFQALEWGIRYPEHMKKLVIIASGASYSTQGIAFNAVGRHAIMHDPQWKQGLYQTHGTEPRKGLATARMLAHITYVSEDSLDQKFGRSLIERQSILPAHASKAGKPFQPEFQVESYLDYQGQQFVNRFDANSYLYLSKALDAFDVVESWGKGDLKTAMARIKADCLFVAYDTDGLFPPKETHRLVDALVALNQSPSAITLSTPWGHDAFLIDTRELNAFLPSFLYGVFTNEASKTSSPPAVLRDDLAPLLSLVEVHDSVLDLGCGTGDLLEILNAQGTHPILLGVEQKEASVKEALSKGLPVLQGDMLHTLSQLPDGSFDVAVLHLALQSLQDPYRVLKEMKRVARRCVIGFPNFGFLPIRLQLLLRGRMPNSSALPYMWYNTPNIHLFTLKDFTTLSEELGFKQARRVYRFGERWQACSRQAWGVNWRASYAIYELV